MNHIRILLEQIMAGFSGLGLVAPLAFIPTFVIGTTLLVPTAILTLAAGALFGAPVGFVVAMISSLTGASAGFLSGRYLSRGWLLKKISVSQKFTDLDHAIAEKGWKIVILLRLSAICPFVILNYGLGLSKIRFKHYFLASLIGSIPGTLLNVYLGSLAGKLVFEPDQLHKTPAEWAIVSVGLVMTLVLGGYSAWIVKKTLKEAS